MENTSNPLEITIRVSSRFYQRSNKEYSIVIDSYNNFFREFPREEIRVLFYDQLKQPMDTFFIEITNGYEDTLAAAVYDTSIELSDFFNMVEATVRDYYERNNLDASLASEDTEIRDEVPF